MRQAGWVNKERTAHRRPGVRSLQPAHKAAVSPEVAAAIRIPRCSCRPPRAVADAVEGLEAEAIPDWAVARR
jgi:hypothetical protein